MKIVRVLTYVVALAAGYTVIGAVGTFFAGDTAGVLIGFVGAVGAVLIIHRRNREQV